MAESHIYRLSSIDQSLIRIYIRYCLCFPCNATDIEAVTTRLAVSVNRTVAHLPILAGTVQPIESNDQSGRLEVKVRLDQINNFEAHVKHHGATAHLPSYQELSTIGMPPSELIREEFTPHADNPNPEGSPVFAIQANFIRGGLILVLYLHHSVADIHGLARIMRDMSSDIPRRELTDGDLRADSLEQSRLRDRLSGSRGVKVDLAAQPEYNEHITDEENGAPDLQTLRGCCCILGFNLNLIDGTKSLVNERSHPYHKESEIPISGYNCLVAILWEALIRASTQGPPDEQQTSTLITPVNVRHKIDPPLSDEFFGNAGVHACAKSAVLHLGMPYELTNLSHIARAIRTSTANITERDVRTAIAAINKREGTLENCIPTHNVDTTLVITSWADLPLDEAHLGLGLGKPQWGRKLGRTQSMYGCIVLPVKREEGTWEVTVHLSENAMARLLRDEGLMKFVKWVA